MPRTYIPGYTERVHELAVFLARWNAVLRAAIEALDPAALPAYDALFTSVLAIDALRTTLDPEAP